MCFANSRRQSIVCSLSIAKLQSGSLRRLASKMLRAALVLLMFAVLGKGEECLTHPKCDCNEFKEWVEVRCSGLTSFLTLKDIPNNTRDL